MSKIYEDLDSIRKRPGMYLGKNSVSLLFTFLNGYRFAKSEVAEVVERIPFEPLPFWLFYSFVAKKYQETGSIGWDGIILKQVEGNEEKGLRLFWELLDEFRKITVIRCWRAELNAENIAYHEKAEKVARYYQNFPNGQMIPVYRDAKAIYKVELEQNYGFLLVVEYEDAYCIGEIYAAFVNEFLDNEELLDRYIENCFGSVSWNAEYREMTKPKRVARSRYVNEGGVVIYWFN